MERRTMLTALAALSLTIGCNAQKSKKSSDDDDDDDDKPKRPKSSRATEKDAPKKDSSRLGAFVLGTSYGYANFFGIVASVSGDQEAVKSRDNNMRNVETMAKALEVTAPPYDEKQYLTHMANTATALRDKHGKPQEMLFFIGCRIVDAAGRHQLGGDLKVYVSDLEKALPKSEVPEGVWKAKLDKIKSSPAKGDFDALKDAIKAELSA
jgi:hypothetical protein